LASAPEKAAEQHMAKWLAHPQEFGEPPVSVRHRRTYRGTLLNLGDVEIHLVEYVMPDGTTGRGFVNGSLTWSFIGSEVNAIDDDDLLQAYCGWAWLFPAVHAGSVETEFKSMTEAQFILEKQEQGFSNLVITSRYRIGTSELFEFTAEYDGTRVKGAGDTADDVVYEEGDPQFCLPAIYFLLAGYTIKVME
jgi:hypothetical protein